MSEPSQKREQAHGGFMLSETIAAMTISAFILAGLVTTASVMLRSADHSVARMQDEDNLIRAMAAISRDAGASIRARWSGAEPQGFIFAGDSSSIMFPDIETAQDGTRHLMIVRYQSDAGHGLVRSSVNLGAFAASRRDLPFVSPQWVYRGSARFRFVYLDAAIGNEREHPFKVWTSNQLLPGAILIEAVDPDGNRVLASMRVNLRANADLGCLSADFCGRKDRPVPGQPPSPSAPMQAQGPTAALSTQGGL